MCFLDLLYFMHHSMFCERLFCTRHTCLCTQHTVTLHTSHTCITAGQLVTVLTPVSYSYENYWFNPIREHFLFRVRACKNAHVIFSSDLQGSINHEVIIGYAFNTKTILRQVQPEDADVVEVSTPGILDCYRDREFWITWADAVFRFGKGRFFEQMVIDYVVPDFQPFTSVSLSTSDETTGEFNYDIKQGTRLSPRGRLLCNILMKIISEKVSK